MARCCSAPRLVLRSLVILFLLFLFLFLFFVCFSLYVVGLVVADAGIYAPICLLMVVFTLWLFRKVYGEAVTALPLNGGAYNVLLKSDHHAHAQAAREPGERSGETGSTMDVGSHVQCISPPRVACSALLPSLSLSLFSTTSKSTAAVAACLTILSYVATAVVSGSEAIEYASHVWSGMPITIGTILLLAVFAVLNLMGISDSATVALAIFVTHLVTVAILVVSALVWVGQHGFHVLQANYWASTQPTLWRAIIFGFSSAMLGVSGFESSANFVEEQKSGVFVKTLRNMWLAVSLINPSVTFLALCIIPQQEMRENQSTVMAEMGRIAAGEWLEKLVSADAFLVLSGGVLTSFVGVTGLCRRLALDRCLPQFLLGQPTRAHTDSAAARTIQHAALCNPTLHTTASIESVVLPLIRSLFSHHSFFPPSFHIQPRINGATRTTGSSSASSAFARPCTSSSTATSRRSQTSTRSPS